MAALRIIVGGKVQGVGYRAYTVACARRLDLSGWVRNRRDGTVEVLVAGAEPTLERFIQSLRSGPRAAVVSGLTCAPAPDPGQDGFVQAPTV